MSSRSGLRSSVRVNASRRRHRAISAWWPDSSTGGTSTGGNRMGGRKVEGADGKEDGSVGRANQANKQGLDGAIQQD